MEVDSEGDEGGGVGAGVWGGRIKRAGVVEEYGLSQVRVDQGCSKAL